MITADNPSHMKTKATCYKLVSGFLSSVKGILVYRRYIVVHYMSDMKKLLFVLFLFEPSLTKMSSWHFVIHLRHNGYVAVGSKIEMINTACCLWKSESLKCILSLHKCALQNVSSH